MAYPAAAVANELLDRAHETGCDLTQINIQKLVYFAHGWHLALQGEPLIQEPIEAWKYGPVVRRLYDAFKSFGSAPITAKAMEWHMSAGGKFVSEIPQIRDVSDRESDREGAYAQSLIGAIWKKYGMLEPFKLVEITHLPGSPWANAIAGQRKTIGNEEIAAYFRDLGSSAA